MPTKRRASTSTDDSAPITTRKAKKPKPVDYNQAAICQELFDKIRNHKLPEGRLLCETLIRAPKRRTTPEYYETISDPIDLLKIQQKLKTDEYEEIEQLTEDVQLLVRNAKAYYQKSAQEHQDAIKLWDLYQTTKSELIAAAFGESSTAEPPKPIDPVIQAKCQQLLDAFKKLKNGDRLLCQVFMTLPDKKVLPDYYQTIKHPIDLDSISEKLRTSSYDSVDLLEHDLNLMLKNAMEYNEPGSTIYKDAETLQLMMRAVMSDIMLASPSVGTSKADKKSRRSSVMVSAAAADPMEEETDTDGDDIDEDNSMLSMGDDDVTAGNPYWLLFKAIATFTDENGKSIAKPFLKLPNKRWFPDYYEDIANPISMTQIKQRIKKKKYNSLNEMAADLNLMFENAKEYNADESKIFQNAIEMQSVMWKKKKQIEETMTSEGIDNTVSTSKVAANRRSGKAKGGRSGKTSAGDVAGEDNAVASGPSSSPSRRAKGGKARGRVFPTDPSELSLKNRLLAIFNVVYDCEDKDGRSLIGPFIELPSKSDYPDYYDYITEPIDMTMIENKITADRYNSEKELMMDLKLMFNNARQYNEDGSQIYNDANTLEKAMKKKVMELSIADTPIEPFSKRTFATVNSSLNEKLNDLYETIKVFKDQHSRVLSTPFVKLPTKQEYAEYYEVIKKPMDMNKIYQKIQSSSYDSLESLLLDITLMFDNAMIFNEPESILYKDAAVLLNEFLKRYDCLDDQSQYGIPDVTTQVQKMLSSLYNTTINHTDEDGRFYVDSINELDSPASSSSFMAIGQNLKYKRYRRLDIFQDDMFAVCENVRKISQSDSQAFEDSVEIQKIFIAARDDICRNGEGSGFSSPALAYSLRRLTKSIEEVTAEKSKSETSDNFDDPSKRKVPDRYEAQDLIEKDGQKYEVGDFVYVTAKSGASLSHIINIERMWKDGDGSSWLFGRWFYRPSETVHGSAKRIMNQEVFCADVFDSVPFQAVIGRCYVMYIKDYVRCQPEGIPEKDVYLCESRYSKKSHAFYKVKNLANVSVNSSIEIKPRAVPMLTTRTPTTVATSKREDKPAIIATSNKPIIKDRKSVTCTVNDGEPGHVYYEQFVAENGMAYKVGDFVYLNASAVAHLPNSTASGPQPIARIEKLYKDERGWLIFMGSLFLRPDSIDHTPARLFYQKEVFLSAAEDKKFNLASVVGKCSVLFSKDYSTYRLTEYPEEHVYVCEWKYIEGETENVTRKISKGFRTPQISPAVCDDEIFYFSKKLSIKRVPSPQLTKLCAESYIQDHEEEDSREQTLTPIHSNFDAVGNDNSRNAASPLASGEKFGKKKKKKHHITSFQLFANDVRRGIQDANPGASFGEVSQRVAAKWRSLPDEEIQRYKEKSVQLQNEAKAKERAEAMAMAAPAPTQFNKDMFAQPGPQAMLSQPPHFQPSQQPQFQQFSQAQQRMMPGTVIIPGQPMPMQPGYAPRPMITADGQQWVPAPAAPGQPQPMYTGQSPMPLHTNMPQYHSRQNMTGSPMHRPSPAQTPDSNNPQQMAQPMQLFQMTPVSQVPAMAGQQVSVATPPQPPRPPSPKFVSVDMPPQKITHSSVYMKYIGGLREDNPVKVSNWERELLTEKMMEPPNPSLLPTHWLANGAGAHGDALSALHALRDVMVQDTLKLKRAYQL